MGRRRGLTFSGRQRSVGRSIFLFSLMAVLIFMALPPLPVEAAGEKQGSSVTKAVIDVKVNTDGTVDITETLAHYFHKPRTRISFDLIFPLEGEPQLFSLEFAQKTAADGEEKYLDIPQEDELKEQPFSYTTTRKNDRIRVDIRMTALSGDYVFRLGYQWNRGVVEKDGHALISGPLLAVRAETLVDTMRWTLSLPEGCQAGHLTDILPLSVQPMTAIPQSASGFSYVDNQSFYKIDGIGLLVSTSINCFPLILPSSETASLQTLFSRAETQIRNLVRMGQFRQSADYFITPLVGAGLFIYLLLYLLQIIRIRRPDEDYACWPILETPALVAELALLRPASSRMLLASILQLINRREIEWSDEVFIWKNPGRNDFSAFTPWEIILLDWLFQNDPAYDHVLAPERLRAAARQAEFKLLAHRFSQQVDQAFREGPLVKSSWTRIFRYVFLGFAVLFLAMALGLFFITHAGIAFFLLIPVAFFSFGGLTFRFLTEEGVRRYIDSRHFMRHLGRPEDLIASCQAEMSDVETMISALPAAVALNKTRDYFEGIRGLSQPYFLRAAYGLLHIYRGIRMPDMEDPGSVPDLRAEIRRLNRALDEMERGIAAWKEYIDSAYI